MSGLTRIDPESIGPFSKCIDRNIELCDANLPVQLR